MCREARKRDRLSVLKGELEKALLFASRRGYLGKNLKKRQILMGKRFFFAMVTRSLKCLRQECIWFLERTRTGKKLVLIEPKE